MQIVVASSNIFHRELTIYLLGEVGYSLAEAATLDELLTCLMRTQPDAIVLDTQLGGIEPARILEALRLHSSAPILWLAESSETAAMIAADEHLAASLAWPYQTGDLCAGLHALLLRSAQSPPVVSPKSRSVGAAE